MSATQLLYRHLGLGSRDDCGPAVGLCWLCAAAAARGQRVTEWSGASFTGQNRVRCPDAEWVCEPCVHVCSRVAPVPGRPPKDGKQFGGNWRNYSHLYDAGVYSNASKGEKPAILSFLRAEHTGLWFAAIADSGQKHVLPWTPVNQPGTRRGVVLFDETLVTLPIHAAAGWAIVEHMAALLTAGATKDEIATARYGARAWQLCDERLRAFEEAWGEKRGGAWFALALWLAQRDEEQVAVRMAAEKEARRGKSHRRAVGRVAHLDGRGAAHDEGGLPQGPEPKRDEALGHPVEQGQERGSARGESRRVGDAARARDAARSAKQGTLPGVG